MKQTVILKLLVASSNNAEPTDLVDQWALPY